MRRLAAVLGLALAAGPAAAQAPPTFSAGVESVYLDVFVTRGGRPVLGLEAGNFEVVDEGRRLRPELVGVESVPLTTLLVFDTSQSVRGSKLLALRRAADAFLAGLRDDDEAGVLCFSEEVRWLARPTTDKAAVRRALESLDSGGGTAAWDALSVALTVLPTSARALVVVFSDGADNMSWVDPAQVRAQAARSNAIVQVVGVTPDEPWARDYLKDLRRVARLTGGRFWEAQSSARLEDAFRAIVEAMNTRYVLRYDLGGGAKPGWHALDVRLRGAKGDVQARQGYWRSR